METVNTLERSTNYKVIISGTNLEIYQYEIEQWKNMNPPKQKIKSPKTEKAKQTKISDFSKHRARQYINRLVHCNLTKALKEDNIASFWTFTFAENLQDIHQANKIFSKFIKRLNYDIYREKCSKIKYLVVTEFQKRGAVHYHALFFNLDKELVNTERKTRRIADVWGHGFIQADLIFDVGQAIGYMVKYIHKNFDDIRLAKKKKYFCSRGLERPVIVTMHELGNTIKAELQSSKEDYRKEYDTKMNGTAIYTTYTLDSETLENILIHCKDYYEKLYPVRT